MEPAVILDEIYESSLTLIGSGDSIVSSLSAEEKLNLNLILEHSEGRKGVFTVLFTSLIYKVYNPSQDVRLHQANFENGYSGRTFDTKFITPFLKSKNFPAPSETGWLTRTLETNSPYTLDYKPNISPKPLKKSFLYILDKIENGSNARQYATYLIQGLIVKRNAQLIDLAKPLNLPIGTIIELLSKHFDKKYSSEGASRLPVLALYAAYQCLINETKRFNDKVLLPMESHTSADSRSGRNGDIDIVDENERAFEAVEVKHGIPITTQLVKDAFEKFKTTQVNRYYLLSTANIDIAQADQINKEIERIKNIHGCHVIANGLTNSLKYYLRLLSDTSEFIENYVNSVETDTALKYEHKKEWNNIISQM